MPFNRIAAAAVFALALAAPQAHARRQGPEPTKPVAAVPEHAKIDGQPFIRLAEQGRLLVETGRIGQESAFELAATAELNEDGSFKPESVKFESRAEADAEVQALWRQLITAVGESRMLGALRDDAKAVRFVARLDRENVALALETEFSSAGEALKWANGYGILFRMAGKSKSGTDEGSLYDAVKFAADGKVFRVSFEMPKTYAAKAFAGMLDRRAARGRQ
jgi:hypothetical protein